MLGTGLGQGERLGDTDYQIGIDGQSGPAGGEGVLALHLPAGPHSGPGIPLDRDVSPLDRPAPARPERLHSPGDRGCAHLLVRVALVDLEAVVELLDLGDGESRRAKYPSRI